MATPSSYRTRAALPATARNSAKPSLPTGGTRTTRTIWPWWTTPSRRASLIPKDLALAAGPTEESPPTSSRSEEHTSELQSLTNLVCHLLLEKKKKQDTKKCHKITAQ